MHRELRSRSTTLSFSFAFSKMSFASQYNSPMSMGIGNKFYEGQDARSGVPHTVYTGTSRMNRPVGVRSAVNPDFWCGNDFWNAYKNCHQACLDCDSDKCTGTVPCLSGVTQCSGPPPSMSPTPVYTTPLPPPSTSPGGTMGYYSYSWDPPVLRSFPKSNTAICFSLRNSQTASDECSDWCPTVT